MKKTEKIFVLNPSENNSFVLTQKTVELEVPAATTAQVTQNEEFARTCRICATTTDYAVPIFTGEGRQNNLCEKIETHLPIMVSPEDHLPQQICVSCAHTLLAWHELVACCRQANDALHMRLHQMQQEQEPQPSTSRETRSQKNKAQKRSEPPPYEDFGQEHCINYPKCPIVQSKLFFHCADCDTYIDLNQLRLHMTLHACHKSMKVESKKKTEEVKDVNANTQPPVTTSRAIMIRAPARVPPVALPRSSKNEFSDHSDTEDFEPLPESVFEAIEDSQDAQEDPEPSTSQNVARNYECHVCGEKFVQQRRLDHHMTSHDGGSAPATNKNTTDRKTRSATAKNRLRKCPKCDKEYTASSSYFYHLKYGHAPKKDKACDICGTTFATVMCLKSHRASVHAVEAGFKCRFCEKTFRSKASVYIHEQTHVGDKRHTCGQCGQSFRWRTHLARHVSRHAAARVGTAGAHVCTRCGKSFAVSYDLRRHAATHSAGTHACKSCGATFAQPRYLKVHMSKKHADDASVSSADATKCSSPSAKSSSSDASELHTKYTKY